MMWGNFDRFSDRDFDAERAERCERRIADDCLAADEADYASDYDRAVPAMLCVAIDAVSRREQT